MKWEATTLPRRLEPCGTDAPRLVGRQLDLPRNIKKTERMTQPPPGNAAGAASGGAARGSLQPAARRWRYPHHTPPAHCSA